MMLSSIFLDRKVKLPGEQVAVTGQAQETTPIDVAETKKVFFVLLDIAMFIFMFAVSTISYL